MRDLDLTDLVNMTQLEALTIAATLDVIGGTDADGARADANAADVMRDHAEALSHAS